MNEKYPHRKVTKIKGKEIHYDTVPLLGEGVSPFGKSREAKVYIHLAPNGKVPLIGLNEKDGISLKGEPSSMLAIFDSLDDAVRYIANHLTMASALNEALTMAREQHAEVDAAYLKYEQE